jgi:hypothetical protein
MARVCMFCGGRPVTLEHVFPDWLGKALPRVRQINVTDDEYRPIWSLGSFNINKKIVCKPCNTGWMSHLEGIVRPLLADPILYGSALTMTAAQQKQVAMWAVKTGMVLESYRKDHPFKYIPDWHARWMVEHPEPPADTTVWMFGRVPDFRPEGTPDFVFTRSVGIVRKEPPHIPQAYISTFAIGHVGFQIFGADSRLDDPPQGIEPTPFLQEHTIRLWPSPTDGVRWPPQRVMSLDLIKRFAQWDQPDPLPRSL